MTEAISLLTKDTASSCVGCKNSHPAKMNSAPAPIACVRLRLDRSDVRRTGAADARDALPPGPGNPSKSSLSEMVNGEPCVLVLTLSGGVMLLPMMPPNDVRGDEDVLDKGDMVMVFLKGRCGGKIVRLKRPKIAPQGDAGTFHPLSLALPAVDP